LACSAEPQPAETERTSVGPVVGRAPEVLGLVTGMQAEAEIARGIAKTDAPDQDVRVMCLGPGPRMASEAAKRLLTVGATRLASFGLAGGLKMSLWPGTAIVAREVIGADGTRYPSDTRWHSQLIGQLIGDDEVVDGDLIEAVEPVITVEEKRALYEASQASAVDMESAAVAAEALLAEKPFIAVRAIADPADRRLPRAALKALLNDGRTSALRGLGHALARPRDLMPMVRLGLDSRAAFATLRRVLVRTGALTGVPLSPGSRMRGG
jgi:adenosylhomocysteine nucleosidase